jgi:hypothetical protein
MPENKPFRIIINEQQLKQPTRKKHTVSLQEWIETFVGLGIFDFDINKIGRLNTTGLATHSQN